MKKAVTSIRGKSLLNRFIFFIGWLLSPLTFWNDSFINIPISYLAASVFVRFIRTDFLLTVLVFYLLTNLLGLYAMYASGERILRNKESRIRDSLVIAGTIVIYSAILIALYAFGILRPF